MVLAVLTSFLLYILFELNYGADSISLSNVASFLKKIQNKAQENENVSAYPVCIQLCLDCRDISTYWGFFLQLLISEPQPVQELL